MASEEGGGGLNYGELGKNDTVLLAVLKVALRRGVSCLPYRVQLAGRVASQPALLRAGATASAGHAAERRTAVGTSSLLHQQCCGGLVGERDLLHLLA